MKIGLGKLISGMVGSLLFIDHFHRYDHSDHFTVTKEIYGTHLLKFLRMLYIPMAMKSLGIEDIATKDLMQKCPYMPTPTPMK